MSKVKIQGNASGTGVLTVTAPNTSTDRTITLPDSTGTLAVNSDVTNKLPLAGGTMTGDLVVSADVDITGSLNGTSGALDIKNEANNQNVFIKTTSSGSEVTALKIHSGGTLELPSGGLRVGGAAAANTLDDYEEGTWTPALTIGSATMDLAHYTKIGRTVTVSAYLSSFSNRTSTSAITITGLPFTQLVGVPSGVAIGRYIDDIDKNHCYVDANTISFYGFTTANWSQLKHNNLTSSSSGMYLSATYQTT
jgi:hypothetical protein